MSNLKYSESNTCSLSAAYISNNTTIAEGEYSLQGIPSTGKLGFNAFSVNQVSGLNLYCCLC